MRATLSEMRHCGSAICTFGALLPTANVMHMSTETPTPGKYGALMGVTKGFGTFLCPRGWGIYCFLLHQFCPWGGGLVRF